MKRLTVLLILGFALIAACMIYLVKNGISLRSAPLISPSVMDDDMTNVGDALVSRLFPDLQTDHDMVLGLLPETDESRALLQKAAAAHERIFGRKPNLIADGERATDEELRTCEKSCWILVDRARANEMTPNDFIERRLKPLGRTYFTVTWVPFRPGAEVTTECLQEKRLTLDCIVPLSIHEARKKMRDPSKRYFFLRKYNESDHFLFTQER